MDRTKVSQKRFVSPRSGLHNLLWFLGDSSRFLLVETPHSIATKNWNLTFARLQLLVIGRRPYASWFSFFSIFSMAVAFQTMV